MLVKPIICNTELYKTKYIHKVHKKYFHIKHRENYVTCQNCDVTISIISDVPEQNSSSEASCLVNVVLVVKM